ncbi:MULTISPECIES: HtaA domain-containing protein [Streptomyces]|uniref:HtaA domain-containing protein n=1 Tax=Streptomyces TaxID=1883 RepID=UPI000A45CDE5|nr:HtaA domain-containing protein [Streptomyces sp. SID7805]MYU53387.1 Htaa domain protein [Streptomyces sp. SID7805]
MLSFRPARGLAGPGRPPGPARNPLAARVRALRHGLRRGLVRVLAVALGVALPAGALTVLLPAAGAQAAARTVAGGRLDWAVKSSFQSYVTGPVARGSWNLTGGAATVGAGRFRFHSAAGSYDPDSGALTAGFSGGVHFTGHRKPDGSYELDLTISRPEVVISGGRGTLYADMTSKEKGTGKVTTSSRVPLASLGVGGLDTRGGGSPIALDNLPATLTSQGASAFAGYYSAGTPLDPVSLSADVRAPGTPGDDASGDPKSGSGDGEKQDGKDGKAAGGDGAIVDAALDWGVRRTFREYVTGAIARGRWQLTDGAQDGGALFRFPRGKGSYDAAGHTLDAAFTGTLRFTGTHLDLALNAVTVTVRDGRGTLTADVTTGGADGADGKQVARKTPLATFEAGQLKPADGLIAVKEAPAKLTEEGAKAFGGIYPAGTAMDPVSLSVAVKEGVRLPALPDLGTDPTAAATPKQREAEPTAASSPATSATSSAVLPLSLAGGAVLIAAAAAFLVLRARRRRAAGDAPPAPPAPQG